MAEYSQNDWRSYLQHDDKKWTWPNGNNSKEYNHWYYTTHPEKWIREKAVEGVKKIGEYAIDKAVDLYDKYFPKESDEEKDYYVENGVNRLKLTEDESQKEDPKVKVEVHADLSNVVKKGESDDDWYVKDGVYRLKDDEYRAEEARIKEEQERRTHELAEDLQTFNKYARMFHSELSHHGILGQKWGQQNGPPYPLDSSDHSASERKAGWRKSLSEKQIEKKDTKWIKKNHNKIYKKTYKQVKKDMDRYERNDLGKRVRARNKDGSLSKQYVNEYNRKLAELMTMKVGDIEAPSGRTVQWIAKRGEVGVYMALADRGYNMDQLKNGIWGSGRVAYKKNELDRVQI